MFLGVKRVVVAGRSRCGREVQVRFKKALRQVGTLYLLLAV